MTRRTIPGIQTREFECEMEYRTDQESDEHGFPDRDGSGYPRHQQQRDGNESSDDRGFGGK